MTEMREELGRHVGAACSLASRRSTRRMLLLGGYVVAGWVGLSVFGGHHAAQAATVDSQPFAATASRSVHAPAGPLGAVTASAHSGPTAAAPSNAASALSQLTDIAPVRNATDVADNVVAGVTSRGADAGPNASTRLSPRRLVGNVADTAGISKPVEETLSAVTAPVHSVRSIHRDVVDPITTSTVKGVVSAVDTAGAPIAGAGTDEPAAPVSSPTPPARTHAPADVPPAPRGASVHHGVASAAHPAEASAVPAASVHRTAVPVPALDPATTARSFAVASPVSAHPMDATQTPRGSLRSGAGAPLAPPQAPAPSPAMPGSAVSGTTGGPAQLGSAGSGSALLSDQPAIAAHARTVYTVQHDNARLARSATAQPSCSPD